MNTHIQQLLSFLLLTLNKYKTMSQMSCTLFKQLVKVLKTIPPPPTTSKHRDSRVSMFFLHSPVHTTPCTHSAHPKTKFTPPHSTHPWTPLSPLHFTPAQSWTKHYNGSEQYRLFYKCGPICGTLFDHLICSIFQSTLHMRYYI